MGRKGSFPHTSQAQSLTGEVREGTRTRVEAGTMEKRCCLLRKDPHACLLWLTQPSSLYNPRSPGVALPTVSWALQHQLLIKKVFLQTCPQANPMEVIPPLRVPLSQVTLVCVKMTQTKQHLSPRPGLCKVAALTPSHFNPQHCSFSDF